MSFIIRRGARFADGWQSLGPAAQRLSLSLFLWGVGEGLWAYLRPLYITQLGADSAGVGLILAIYGLAPMLVMLPAGRLSDLFGPRGLMIGAWWIGTVGQVGLAFAPEWHWLAPGVFLLAGSAAGVPAMNAYVALDATRRLGVAEASRRMQTLLSRVMAIYVAGTIVSPLVGGWLAERLGLRVVLLMSAGWFLMSTLLVHTLPPIKPLAPPPDKRPSPDERPAAWWRMSADQLRVFGVLLLVYLCFSLGYSLVPSYMEDVRQLPVATIGGLGSATALGGTIWLLVLGRRSSRQALVIAAGMLIAAWTGLLLIPGGAVEAPALVGVYFLLGVYSGARSLSLTVVGEHTDPDRRGTSFGLIETMFGIGTFVGPWLAGRLYGLDPRLPFGLARVAASLLMPVIWLALTSPRGANSKRGQPSAAPVEVSD